MEVGLVFSWRLSILRPCSVLYEHLTRITSLLSLSFISEPLTHGVSASLRLKRVVVTASRSDMSSENVADASLNFGDPEM
jgi:hypothetical protein